MPGQGPRPVDLPLKALVFADWHRNRVALTAGGGEMAARPVKVAEACRKPPSAGEPPVDEHGVRGQIKCEVCEQWSRDDACGNGHFGVRA